MLARFFYSNTVEQLEMEARKSDDPAVVYQTVDYLKKYQTTAEDIKAYAWLAKVITLGTKSHLYNQKHILREEERLKNTGAVPEKSHSLACCFFLAMMLRDSKLDILENSGWIKGWNSYMQNLFNTINKKRRPLKLDGSDSEMNQLLEIAKRDTNIFGEFFTYCFDQSILGGGFAPDLGITYTPKNSPKRDEHDGLLAKRTMSYS